MAHAQRNVLVFDYDSFPPVPETEWGGSELRQAVILAGVLAERIAGGAMAHEEPVQEDFGAVLPVATPDGIVDVVISFYPRDSSDFTWALQFRESKGLLRTLFTRSQNERIIGPVREAVGRIVVSHPSLFRNVEWRDPTQL
jgi:hypothetical protein